MQKRIVITALLGLFLAGAACLPRAAAQESTQEAEAQFKPTGSYKVEFTVNELENGKKTNSRSYSTRMNANTLPKWTELQHVRVGSRVPFAVEAGKFEYVDIGTNIDCRLMPMGKDYVVIDATWAYSSVGGERLVAHETQNPVIRQVRANVEAVVSLDKPTVISELDDVASTHHYVFEVKVTKIIP